MVALVAEAAVLDLYLLLSFCLVVAEEAVELVDFVGFAFSSSFSSRSLIKS